MRFTQVGRLYVDRENRKAGMGEVCVDKIGWLGCVKDCRCRWRGSYIRQVEGLFSLFRD